MTNEPSIVSGNEPKFELLTSRQFTAWLAEQRASLAFTTYQAGKLFLVGLQPSGRLSVLERTCGEPVPLFQQPPTGRACCSEHCLECLPFLF